MNGGLPLIITRPSPGAEASAARAIAMGIDAHALPLLAARVLAWRSPDPAGFDALLLTSARAPNLAGTAIAALSTLPCYAVGEATAAAARAAGLAPVQTGSGDAQHLLDAMVAARRCRILWPCGRDHIMLAAGGAMLVPLPCYAVDPVEPPPLWHAMIARPAVIAVHSARAARHLSERVGGMRNYLKLAVISPAVAVAAGSGWAEIAVADTPDDAALLAKARALCHKGEQVGRAKVNKNDG